MSLNRVFISHASGDKNYAFLVKNELEQRIDGYEGWVFQSGIPGGTEWLREIQNAIWSSSALILIVTPKIKRSKWVFYEWIFALGAQKTIVPVVFKATNLLKVHPIFEYIQKLDFTKSDVRDWTRLVQALTDASSKSISTSISVPLNASPAIRNAIKSLDENQETCIRTIQDLRDSRDPNAVIVLKETAEKHHLPLVRINAAFAHIKKTDYADIVLPTIREAVFFDGSIEIRRNAISILGNMGGDSSVEILLEALEKEYVDKRQIIKALGRTKNRNAVLPLSHYLASGKDNSIHDVTLAALDQLRASIGNITNEEAASVILQGIQNQPNIFAIKAISFVGNSALIPELAEIYENYGGQFRIELGNTIQFLRST